MKHALALSCILVLTLAAIGSAKEYTIAEFKQSMSQQTESESIVALCKDYIENATDLELIEVAARIFRREDEAMLDQFIKTKVTENPKSVTFRYLAGSRLEDPLAMVSSGRELIELAPGNAAGYIVLARGYTMGLFAPRMSHSKKVPELEKTLAKDAHYFDAMIGMQSPRDELKLVLTLQKIYSKKYDEALKDLEIGIAEKQPWADPSLLPLVHSGAGNYDKARSTVESYVQSGIERGQYKAADKARISESMFCTTLLMVGAYDEAIKIYAATPDLDTRSDTLYDLACAYALKGDADKAFESLNKAAAAGYDDHEGAAEDSDLEALQKDARWPTTIEAMKAAHSKGAAKRKDAALLTKVTKDAPDWELKTPAGKSVKLSDLKGKIVILDFWATWCGPCMMAMPALDQWCKTKKPENVEVYSINVWEQNPKKAQALFEQKKFAMTLLLGTEEVAKSYGITGIPYICAIDKTGKIRYEQNGFSREFEETLGFWVEDLNQ
mgnify:CR=1 FL=1